MVLMKVVIGLIVFADFDRFADSESCADFDSYDDFVLIKVMLILIVMLLMKVMIGLARPHLCISSGNGWRAMKGIIMGWGLLVSC